MIGADFMTGAAFMFSDWCSVHDWCSFHNSCSFHDWCSFHVAVRLLLLLTWVYEVLNYIEVIEKKPTNQQNKNNTQIW